ncbi:MAG: 1,4-alpha-glucan-branching enzyme [Gemmatimonadetes bacterium]|jgi:1,4-alpha-glucan branching enzyme|nr:1,4-alpha-glucan-branching enzyme [Gemmatimonadota bacterium]
MSPAPVAARVDAARIPPLSDSDRAALVEGRHGVPHQWLGPHAATIDGVQGLVVRVLQPDAADCMIVRDGVASHMRSEGDGLFVAFLSGAKRPVRYSLRFIAPDGHSWERGDAYRHGPSLGEMDVYLFREGTHRRLWDALGAHLRTIDGDEGTAFAVWAPNATRVSVVGDWCNWDGRQFPMRRLDDSGLWELFIPGVGANALYKFELRTREGLLRVKTDPIARKMQQSPLTASIVVADDGYAWRDDAWMAGRPTRSPVRGPMHIYEVHLGSWARVPEEGDRSLTYREIAPRLAEHVKMLGFTHVELLPVAEHPFYGSWGYQITGYYAPTSRYGSPDDLRFLIDTLHQTGIGVLLDWVPAHFPRDDYALRRFDGTALYEHEDPRLGEHPDWGTLIFNYGRKEVRNYLVANALYWLHEFHVDGLRVDAVASMLYLDYSRKAGEWVPNRHGGRENLEAIDFLREMNDVVCADAPGCVTIAEDSTAWPGVTRPIREGGLGFTFKWNMGWMHDTLGYFERDPLYRRFHQDELTFAMMYEHSEHFIMPLSHDEMVHLKGSLYEKMPGDHWQKLANLRALLTYQVTRPGKSLLFMGAELAVPKEWNHDVSLDWHLLEQPDRAAFMAYVARLGHLYQELPAMWGCDAEPRGFEWIDVTDRANSVLSYMRRDGDAHAIVIMNLTPHPHPHYRIGVPGATPYTVALSSDDTQWGGSGYAPLRELVPDDVPYHGRRYSVQLALPPLSALVLVPVPHEPASLAWPQPPAKVGR